MNSRIRAGLIGGIFGLLISLVSGGQIAYLAGIIAGAIASQLAAQEEDVASVRAGIQLGLRAGLVAGALTALGVFIRGFLINPLVNVSADASVVFMLGLGGLVMAGVAGVVFGAIRGLPSPQNRFGTLLAFGLLAVAYPFLDSLLNLRFMNEVIPVLIFILMALGLNIVVGYAGLLDLGYAAFFAIGAYTTGMLASPHFGISMPFWIVIWIAAAVAALFGILLGAPTLPLRGDYLAIVTLGFGEIVPIAANNLDNVTISILGVTLLENFDLTGGPRGINPINRPSLFGYAFEPSQPIPWYFLILGLIVFSIFFILRLRNSRLGRAWSAMREDELAASAMGINLVRTKLLAFAMGATFSGFAGAFYGSFISAITPASFGFDVSVILLCMVILGGLGNITGVILGGLIIQFADRLFLPQLGDVVQGLLQNSNIEVLKEINFKTDFRTMLFGLTLVIMMLVRPEGLVPNERRRRELHADDEATAHERQTLYDAEQA
ncbi:MAG: branched-chain amino acid ABC transporter permease [Roseiflexaceae bacterium]|nr:branched-chain amino acid ABC transporter permease [Roseiflexaceae bacterium]